MSQYILINSNQQNFADLFTALKDFELPVYSLENVKFEKTGDSSVQFFTLVFGFDTTGVDSLKIQNWTQSKSRLCRVLLFTKDGKKQIIYPAVEYHHQVKCLGFSVQMKPEEKILFLDVNIIKIAKNMDKIVMIGSEPESGIRSNWRVKLEEYEDEPLYQLTDTKGYIFSGEGLFNDTDEEVAVKLIALSSYRLHRFDLIESKVEPDDIEATLFEGGFDKATVMLKPNSLLFLATNIDLQFESAVPLFILRREEETIFSEKTFDQVVQVDQVIKQEVTNEVEPQQKYGSILPKQPEKKDTKYNLFSWIKKIIWK